MDPTDTLWQNYERHSGAVKTCRRSTWTGKEKRVDSSIVKLLSLHQCFLEGRPRVETTSQRPLQDKLDTGAEAAGNCRPNSKEHMFCVNDHRASLLFSRWATGESINPTCLLAKHGQVLACVYGWPSLEAWGVMWTTQQS